APIFEQMIKNADITPNVMPPLVEYHEREADGQVYGFYLNLSDKENYIVDVKGFDLVSQTDIDGTLTLKGYGVAVVKKC
ncbi:MAG: Beta-galactosidase C-terminal domain, partial [Oscillospiraceae bacterium]|nr:Beta-galactosidase C-terminal domain [Oscillospiraceae bacterium]